MAPDDMRELFEQYIVAAIGCELRQLQSAFSDAERSVKPADKIDAFVQVARTAVEWGT